MLGTHRAQGPGALRAGGRRAGPSPPLLQPGIGVPGQEGIPSSIFDLLWGEAARLPVGSRNLQAPKWHGRANGISMGNARE